MMRARGPSLSAFSRPLALAAFAGALLGAPMSRERASWASPPRESAPATLAAARPRPPQESLLDPFAEFDEEDGVLLMALAPERPIILRLRLKIGNRLAHEVRGESMRQLFRELDENRDQSLSPQEWAMADWQRGASPARPGNGLSDFVNKLFGGVAAASPVLPTTPGKTAADFSEMYRSDNPLLRLTQSNGRHYPGLGRVFALLDQDESGGLGADELAQAGKRLLSLDFNDDGHVSIIEPHKLINPAAAQVGAGGDAHQGFLSVLMPQDAVSQTADAAARYASGVAVAAYPASFQVARYDLNQDAVLDRSELAAMFLAPPVDAELEVTVPPRRDRAARNLAATASPALSPASKLVVVRAPQRGRRGPQDAWVEAGGAQLHLVASQTNAYDPIAQAVDRFNALDKDKNDYLDQSESNGDFFTNQIFAVADRDRDNKLFKSELEAFVRQQNLRLGASVEGAVVALTDPLFFVLDGDGDGKLSELELSQARQAMRLDKNQDGQLTKDELPTTYRIDLQPARPELFRQYIGTSMEPNMSRESPPAPSWFNSLDRNGDQRVTRDEFPGDQAAFSRLDPNADQAITPDEAAKASK